jgi:hypothetical protein
VTPDRRLLPRALLRLRRRRHPGPRPQGLPSTTADRRLPGVEAGRTADHGRPVDVAVGESLHRPRPNLSRVVDRRRTSTERLQLARLGASHIDSPKVVH